MFDTIIVVTDRKVLDNQLRRTILSLERTVGVVGGVEQGSKELKEFLEKGRDIVVTTIPKISLHIRHHIRFEAENVRSYR